MHTLILSVVLPLLSTQAAPQGEHRQKAALQRVDFSDSDVIEAGVERPGGQFVTTPKRPDFGRMIEVRANFNDKLMQSASEL